MYITGSCHRGMISRGMCICWELRSSAFVLSSGFSNSLPLHFLVCFIQVALNSSMATTVIRALLVFFIGMIVHSIAGHPLPGMCVRWLKLLITKINNPKRDYQFTSEFNFHPFATKLLVIHRGPIISYSLKICLQLREGPGWKVKYLRLITFGALHPMAAAVIE